MIFVTVGTTDFDQLVLAADALAAAPDADFVIQIGHGHVEPKHARWFRMAPSLEPYYEEAELVITHGGLGTLTEVLQRDLPAVGVSNPDRYDRHQDQILRALSEAGHLIWCQDLADLPEAIGQARSTRFVLYRPPESRIHEVIRDFLRSIAGEGP